MTWAEVFREVLIESVGLIFIWLGVPAILYGILSIWLNWPTIKARRRRRRRVPIEPQQPRRRNIAYPDDKEVVDRWK